MKELHLVIVSPEKLVYEGKVSQATFPGSAGKFQVMADHAPIISTLSAGEVKYVAGQETQSLQIKGGFVEVKENQIFSLCGTLRGAKQAMNRICFWRLFG